MNTIQVPAILDGVSPRKDGGMGLRFITNEMSADQKLLLLSCYQQFGWVLFKPSETSFSDEELPKYDPADFDEKKSPSERLRGVMYVYATQVLHIDPHTFPEWYRKETEKLINFYKAKLPSL